MTAATLTTRPATVQLLVRAWLLGVASGSRSSLGIAGPVLSTARPARRFGNGAMGRRGSAVAALSVAGELVADKLPMTPSRLDRRALPLRFLSGAGGAAALARREGAPMAWPVCLGAVGCAVGAFGGFAWRQWAAGQLPDWQAALLEDGVALTLAAAACWPRHNDRG